MLRTIGADVVGMSCVGEVTLARHCGLQTVAIAVVVNHASAFNDGAITHDETLHFTGKAASKMRTLVGHFGIWDLGFGILCVVVCCVVCVGFGIWHLAFGIWHLGIGIWDSVCGVVLWCGVCWIWDLGFGIWDCAANERLDCDVSK